MATLINFFLCFAVFVDEPSPVVAEPEKEDIPQSSDCSFSNSPDPESLARENHQGEGMLNNTLTLLTMTCVITPVLLPQSLTEASARGTVCPPSVLWLKLR